MIQSRNCCEKSDSGGAFFGKGSLPSIAAANFKPAIFAARVWFFSFDDPRCRLPRTVKSYHQYFDLLFLNNSTLRLRSSPHGRRSRVLTDVLRQHTGIITDPSCNCHVSWTNALIAPSLQGVWRSPENLRGSLRIHQPRKSIFAFRTQDMLLPKGDLQKLAVAMRNTSLRAF